MNIDRFECRWEPCPRMAELQDRLQQYYAETPGYMSKREALLKSKEFTEWCRAEGYTSEERRHNKTH